MANCHRTGDDNCPDVIEQTQVTLQNEAGDHAGAETVGHVEDHGVTMSALEVAPREGERNQDGHGHLQQNVADSVEQGVAETNPNLLILQNEFVTFRTKLDGPQNNSTCFQCSRAGEGAGDTVNDGVTNDEDNQDQEDGSDQVQHFITEGFVDLRGFYFRHYYIPPFLE
jgi:hypothetical protein